MCWAGTTDTHLKSQLLMDRADETQEQGYWKRHVPDAASSLHLSANREPRMETR